MSTLVTTYNLPTCATGCENPPAIVEFDNCNPFTRSGPIEYLYLRARGSAFADWTDPAEWAGAISNSGTGPDVIREFHGIGTWAEAASNDIQISGDRTITGVKTFTIQFTVDETNDTNYQWVRENECNGNYSIWFEDSTLSEDSRLYGDNPGIKGFVKANFTIEADQNAIHKIIITVTWKSRFHPDAIPSPIVHA